MSGGLNLSVATSSETRPLFRAPSLQLFLFEDNGTLGTLVFGDFFRRCCMRASASLAFRRSEAISDVVSRFEFFEGLELAFGGRIGSLAITSAPRHETPCVAVALKITVGGAIEAEAARRFVDAWHRAERGESLRERHLAFESGMPSPAS